MKGDQGTATLQSKKERNVLGSIMRLSENNRKKIHIVRCCGSLSCIQEISSHRYHSTAMNSSRMMRKEKYARRKYEKEKEKKNKVKRKKKK